MNSNGDDEDEERRAIQAEAGTGSRRAPAPRRARPLRDTRLTIRLDPGEPHIAADRAVEALRNDPDLYQRDGSLVHVTPTADDESTRSGRKRSIALGTPQIVVMAAQTLYVRITAQSKWERFDERKGEYVRTEPPDRIVKAISTRKHWPGIRRLLGILEAPSLRSDGTVLEEPGYDDETGYLYIPNTEFPAVPQFPAQDEARAALAQLEDVFIDFPYIGDADRSVAIAALLTLVARPAIDGATPAFLFDSNAPGSGKSLQASAIVAVATGRPGGNQSYPEDPNELDKILGAVALEGARFVNFDNIVGRFGRGTLDRCISAVDSVSLRVLGKSEQRTMPWRTVILGSGNNIEVGADAYRRVLLGRINTPYEDAEQRPISNYKHPERYGRLLDHVIAKRPSLIVAALTLLRAFIVAGRPAQVGTMAGFERWAELVPAAIVWAGGADPLRCRPVGEANHDPKRDAMRTILESWSRLDSLGQGLTIRSLIELLFTKERLRGEAAPDGLEDMRAAIQDLVATRPGQQPDAKKLGDQFRHARGRNVGGKMIDAAAGAQRGVTRWVVCAVPVPAAEPNTAR